MRKRHPTGRGAYERKKAVGRVSAWRKGGCGAKRGGHDNGKNSAGKRKRAEPDLPKRLRRGCKDYTPS